MPVLAIKTNITAPSNQSDILQSLSKMTAGMLSKPESYVMVLIEYEQTMLFAGEDAATAYVELKSLGLPESKTAEYSQTICEKLKQSLAIDPARIYIEFASPERQLFGWNNSTF